MNVDAWTPLEHARAARMWREGHSTKEIAEALGRSRAAVFNHISRNRDDFARRCMRVHLGPTAIPPRAPAIIKEIIALAGDRGWSHSQLCEVAGVAKGTFNNWTAGRTTPPLAFLAILAATVGQRVALVPDADAEAVSQRAQAALRRRQQVAA